MALVIPAPSGDAPCLLLLGGEFHMRVGKPSALMFIISCVFAVLAVLAMLTNVPVVDGHEFIFMFLAWAVLALSTVVRGV
jgi:hypothetical protein